MIIDESNLSHAWIRMNTKEGTDRTGVSAVVILCFGTKTDAGLESDSRIALWYGKSKPGGKLEFLTPSFTIDAPNGEGNNSPPCIYGALSVALVKMAETAQARLKAAAPEVKIGYGKFYKIGEKVEVMG